MAGVTSVVIDGTTYLVDDINAVDFSDDQGLSEQQQEQGRSNIGAAAEEALEGKADETDLNALAGTVGELSDDVDALTEAMTAKADKADVEELTEQLADKASAIVDTASGAIASFPDGAAVAAKDITIGIEPVQSGSGDPSPENVRPISGWTGANVTACGVNLLDPDGWTSGARIDISNGGVEVTSPAFYAHDYIDVNPNTTYTCNWSYYSSGNFGMAFYDKNKTYLSGIKQGDITSSATEPFTFTTPANARYIRVSASAGFSDAMQINVGSSASAYKPYNANTVSISWQSVAGTVYGGTLDVTTGLLTVTMVSYSVELVNTAGALRTNGDYYAAIIGINNAKPVPNNNTKGNCLCNIADNMSATDRYSSTASAVSVRANGTIELCVNGITTASALNSYLSNNNVQLVYELATPQTYQLTPVEIEMLLGDNNVWADTGDSTVVYRADTKLYIQKINAPTDDDMIADAQIASGKYFIVGGNLYKSTTTIPAGDSINPGSNCILTNLADALNALNT